MFFALLLDRGDGLEGVLKPVVKAEGRGKEEDLTLVGKASLVSFASSSKLDFNTRCSSHVHNTDSKVKNRFKRAKEACISLLYPLCYAHPETKTHL